MATQELQFVLVIFVLKVTHLLVISLSVALFYALEMAKIEENVKRSSTFGLG